ncbi:BAG domain-containing protein [Mycena kentingensis (nom. inval.)]|nr:BAG domain-containing protein [Mycena kentingensis (nom. inval.)]
MFPANSYYPRPASSPRDKYLAALAEAKAAEAEYLAAERLQQEEDDLRRRLDQIQSLKHHRAAPVYPSYHHQPAVDIDALRRQIAAEERERILREQEQERRHKQELKALEARHHAQAAERERVLAAQEAKLAALTRRAEPVRHFVNGHKQHQPKAIYSLDDLFSGLVRVVPAAKAPEPETVTLEQFLGSILGVEAAPPKPVQCAPKAPVPPTAPTTQTITLDQLLGNIFGGAAVPKPEAAASSSSAAPTPAPAKPAPAPATAPSQPAPQPTPFAGLEEVFKQFIPTPERQEEIAKFLSTFAQPCPQPQASSSKSTEDKLRENLETRLRSEQAKEDQDLAEAIRMSLADLDGANASSNSKGKAPAPAPVKNTTTSAAEIKEITDAFTALSNDWGVPEKLDFSTSRTTSPVRGSGASDADSVMARLTYSAHNQPVRYYHQALSKLLARLDTVESFGDEEVRHARKEAVGKVEGALDEVESVIEARWRKSVGRERQSAADDAVSAEVAVAEEAAPAVEVVHPAPVVEEPVSPVTEQTPALPEESTETIRPYELDLTPAPASPVVSEPEPTVDTFLLPAEPVEEPKQSKRARVEEEVESDWSAVEQE